MKSALFGRSGANAHDLAREFSPAILRLTESPPNPLGRRVHGVTIPRQLCRLARFVGQPAQRRVDPVSRNTLSRVSQPRSGLT